MPRKQKGVWASDIVTLVASAGVTVLLMFLLWEVIEKRFATSDEVAHLMHYARGISSSLVTAIVVGLLSYRQHLRRANALELEVERRTKELGQARKMLQVIVDTTPAALVVLDEHLRVVQANRSAEIVHGGPLAGRLCYEALAGRDDMCDECPAIDSFAGQASARVSGQRRDPRTGEVLEIECHPLSLGEGQDYMLLVERIVTEQKKLEARLLHQEKMAAFGLLAAEVAHDMGNPLSSIDAQLQLLDRESLREDVVSVVETVRSEVARLHRILRELVDFARRRRDEASLVSVQSVVEDALRLLRHDRRMRRVETMDEYDAETPPVFMVEDHLMQVVLNLLINAIDAMPEGGTLGIELLPVGHSVALRIHDTGVGMDRPVLQQCLEPLFTTKEQGKGTGLGLSITKDIVEAAGGSVDLHSSLGSGTTVTVTLPAASSAIEEQADSEAARHPHQAARLS
jgi:signal transduction histidine kinase